MWLHYRSLCPIDCCGLQGLTYCSGFQRFKDCFPILTIGYCSLVRTDFLSLITWSSLLSSCLVNKYLKLCTFMRTFMEYLHYVLCLFLKDFLSMIELKMGLSFYLLILNGCYLLILFREDAIASFIINNLWLTLS